MSLSLTWFCESLYLSYNLTFKNHGLKITTLKYTLCTARALSLFQISLR
jgi:hypothetical protein